MNTVPESLILRPGFTSNLVHELAFGTSKFYIAPYGKINHRVVNLSYNCDMKLGLRVPKINISEFANCVDPNEVTHNVYSLFLAHLSRRLRGSL